MVLNSAKNRHLELRSKKGGRKDKKRKKEEKRRLQLACRALPEEGKDPRVNAAPNQSKGTGQLRQYSK